MNAVRYMPTLCCVLNVLLATVTLQHRDPSARYLSAVAAAVVHKMPA